LADDAAFNLAARMMMNVTVMVVVVPPARPAIAAATPVIRGAITVTMAVVVS
jgi:hypothetical protein